MGLQQYAFRDALAEAGDGFDVVLIDCPPHTQVCAWSALVAADGVVVPVQPEDYGAQGLKSIRRTIAHAQSAANAQLALIAYLVSMFNKSLSVHVTYEGYLRELHGADVFATVIPQIKDYKEAVTYRKPIVEYQPHSRATH